MKAPEEVYVLFDTLTSADPMVSLSKWELMRSTFGDRYQQARYTLAEPSPAPTAKRKAVRARVEKLCDELPEVEGSMLASTTAEQKLRDIVKERAQSWDHFEKVVTSKKFQRSVVQKVLELSKADIAEMAGNIAGKRKPTKKKVK